MLKDNIAKALNEQLNKELYSSYLYLSMSAYYDSVNLPGFANWMRVQAQEEYAHAMMFYDYLLNTDSKVILAAIEAPKIDWNDKVEVFEDTLTHEKFVSESINNLIDLAYTSKDFATVSFLNWFVTEQVEEEANASKILERLKMIGDNQGGLFFLDAELAKRVFVAPTPAQA